MYAETEYLKQTNITKLATAARMAGLRWKSGTPGYDKAGIIEKLTLSPGIMRATVATLKRMESAPAWNDPGKNPFADALDDAEELNQPSPSPAPAKALEGYSVPPETITRILSEIAQLKTGKANTHDIPRALEPISKALSDHAQYVTRELASLKERAPIQFNIPNKPSVTIDPNGHHRDYPKLLKYLQINRRVILTGSAGTGKSMAVHNAAKAFNLPFHLQTPVTMDHQFLGHRDAQGTFHETPTFKAYTQGGVLLWDEADAGLPDAMLAANPIFDGNGFAMFGDGNMYKQHPDFMAVFNMNTDGNGASMEYAGRNRLDGATLARFGVRIHWGIDDGIEAAMAGTHTAWLEVVRAVRRFMSQRSIVDVNATPRHTKTGAALLECGLPKLDVLTDVLKSGALSEVWQDILRLTETRRFLEN